MRHSTVGRGIYFGHFRLKSLRLHRSAAKKSRQRLWHDDAASARFQPSSGRGRRSRWRAPPRSAGEFVCSWGHHSGRHALGLLRCDGSAATKTSWRCAPSRRAHPQPQALPRPRKRAQRSLPRRRFAPAAPSGACRGRPGMPSEPYVGGSVGSARVAPPTWRQNGSAQVK